MGNKKYNALDIKMKEYEKVSKPFLTLGVPKIIRLDMRAGHTFCKKFDKPFDKIFSDCMVETTKELCKQIPGVVAGYTQSDEISLILNDETKNGFECFFNGNVEKIVSISASICTLEFNRIYADMVSYAIYKDEHYFKNGYANKINKALFDSRVFCLPNVTEVHNYVLSRQLDATKNSIASVGQAYFTTEELKKKKSNDIQDMLMLQKGINWNDFPTRYKRGCIVLKETYLKDVELPNGEIKKNVERKHWVEKEIPILTKDETFISSIYHRKDK
ncbi:MAG: tRNA(His) guanylyltransferase Thg1 family protein [Bacilli bacterium]|nr:tRNA(His) guanylyltransferase Thg1 family protein [Bacilli bacterium]